MNADRRR